MRGNVLFITADQWRGECLSAIGHPVVRTPSLDALAGQGVLFRRHYAQAAPCGPSRASLHTGLYLQNHRSGTNGTPLDDRHTNWALEVRKLGYDPVLFGYTDTSRDPRSLEPDSPWRSSYEGPLPGLRPVVLMGENPVAWAAWLEKKGYALPDEPWKLYWAKKSQPEWEAGGPSPAPLAIPAEHHDTHFMVDQVIEYLAGAGAEPWIVHLSLYRPHPPWVAPEPYHALYDPASLPGFARAESAEAEAACHPWLAFHLERRRNRAPADERKLRRLKASYYGLMTEVDHELGRLFAWLESQGLWQDTLVVFTSDHGEQMGDHWVLGKAGWFEASYRVPLVVRDPRASADGGRGCVVDSFTENVDLMPTLLSWVGAEVPLACDGRSLLPFLGAGAAPEGWRGEVHHEYDFRDVRRDAPGHRLGLAPSESSLAVLRDERGKYVHFAGLPPLFFDLEHDPDEQQDLARDPACAPRVLEYAQRMLSWRLGHAEQALGHLHLGPGGVFERREGEPAVAVSAGGGGHDVPEVAPVRRGEEQDWARAEGWIRERMPELPATLEVLQFPGGHANLTYLLRFGGAGGRELVLRRPPFGPVAPGSHDMVREHKVLSRLWPFLGTAPRAYLLCEDEAVIGGRFFVMERRTGVVLRTRIPDEMRHHSDVARRVSVALVDAMADLHDVDYAKADLADLGKPEGFAERQVAGWKRRWDAAKDRELPLFDAVHARLASTVPPAARASLVHNDLKLDNCQFDPADPDRVKSIFDWDMTTLGDPLVDLGTLLGYWSQADDPADRSPTNALTNQGGFPTRRELAERYAARRDVPLESIAWYEAFAIWKTAVVLQQIYTRFVRGQTSDERFHLLGPRVPTLVQLASDLLG